jgi:hypothetical protein
MLIRYILIPLVLLMLGCSTSKKMSHAELMKEAPAWVKQIPNSPAYFHGVGMSVKSTQQDFRERARQNALSELAGGISVDISSTSVLNQFEIDNSYSEFFRDNIRVSSQQFLEGYELVENWENDIQYWVYYRLSKAKYAQVKQERMNSALNLSLSKFEQARQLGNQGRANDALGFYIRSVEDIRDFWGEELKAEIDGEQKTYATLLMAGLMDQIQSLKFDFSVDKFKIKPGPSAAVRPLDVIVRDKDGRPVSGIPVITRYSWRPGNITEAVTDSRGMFRIMPQGISPGKRSELISCYINMKKISANTTQDAMVQRLFSSFNVETYNLPLELVPPVCFISVTNPGGQYNVQSVKDELKRLFIQDGIEIASEEVVSDYFVDTEINQVNLSQVGNRFTNMVNATLVLKDRNGNIHYSARADRISGLGNTADEAWEDAMKSLKNNIRINLYPAMINDAFTKNQ